MNKNNPTPPKGTSKTQLKIGIPFTKKKQEYPKPSKKPNIWIPDPPDISDINFDFEGKETNIEMFIHGINPETTYEELESYLSRRCDYQDLIYKKNKTRKNLHSSYAFFQVGTKKIALNLITHSGVLKGRLVHCDIKYNDPEKYSLYNKKRLFMGNLAPYWTNKEIHKAVERYGRIRGAYSIKDSKTGKSKRYGFIDFYCVEDAEIFLKRGTITLYGREIEVKPYYRNKDNGNKVRLKEKKNFKNKFTKDNLKGEMMRNLDSNLEMKAFVMMATKMQMMNSGEKSSYRDQGEGYYPAVTRQQQNFSFRNEEINNEEEEFLFEEERVENQILNRRRYLNLKVIGVAMRDNDLFSVPRRICTLRKVIHQSFKIIDFNRAKVNYVLNSPNCDLDDVIVVSKEALKDFIEEEDYPRNISNLNFNKDQLNESKKKLKENFNKREKSEENLSNRDRMFKKSRKGKKKGGFKNTVCSDEFQRKKRKIETKLKITRKEDSDNSNRKKQRYGVAKSSSVCYGEQRQDVSRMPANEGKNRKRYNKRKKNLNYQGKSYSYVKKKME